MALEANYMIDRFSRDEFGELNFESTRYVGQDYAEAVATLAADREAAPGTVYKLRTVYTNEKG